MDPTYTSLLTIDHSISQISWPSRTTSVYAWCEAFTIPVNYERGNLARHYLLRLNGLLAVVLLEPDRLRPINPACMAIGAMYVFLFVDFFSRFTWVKNISS